MASLTEIGLVHGDSSKANVLFDVDARSLARIDLEHALHNTYNLGIDNALELYSIMWAVNG